MRSPSATTSRCTWCWIISASASNSGASGAIVTSANVASSRTGSAASGRPSTTARCRPVLVKMPSRSPSRTSTLLRALRLHQRGHARRCRSRRRRRAPGAGRRRRHARHRQRLHLALAVALRQRAELVRQVREQQRAEGRVARDQRVDGGLRQLVGQHLLGGDEAAAGAAGDQRAAVEAVVRARSWRPARRRRTARRGP